MWKKLADRMERCDMSKEDIEAVIRVAERCARRDGRCVQVALYGDYLKEDYAPEEAWTRAVSYLRYCADRMDAPRWARVSQMLATARLFYEEKE